MPADKTVSHAADLMVLLLAQMTRFSCLGCPELAAHIRHELERLQACPDDQIALQLKRVVQRLEGEWAQLYSAIADEPLSGVASAHGGAGDRRALH